MKAVNGFDLMKFAQDRGYLLPAFNTTNLEMTYGIVKGLNMAGMPGYIQISSSNLKLSNPGIIADIARDALKESTVPIGLHLDHGKSFEDVKRCVEAGFTSIMIDASHLSFEQNVEVVRKTVDYCHFYHIPVEAELGALQGKEDDLVGEVESKTNPERAAVFARKTGCDLLAVSVGNVHGLELTPAIDLPLLKEISKKVSCPLVMHGGSGIPFDIVRKAKNYHLIKINYGAELRKKYIMSFGETYEANHNAHDVYTLSARAVEEVAAKACDLVQKINGVSD